MKSFRKSSIDTANVYLLAVWTLLLIASCGSIFAQPGQTLKLDPTTGRPAAPSKQTAASAVETPYSAANGEAAALLYGTSPSLPTDKAARPHRLESEPISSFSTQNILLTSNAEPSAALSEEAADETDLAPISPAEGLAAVESSEPQPASARTERPLTAQELIEPEQKTIAAAQEPQRTEAPTVDTPSEAEVADTVPMIQEPAANPTPETAAVSQPAPQATAQAAPQTTPQATAQTAPQTTPQPAAQKAPQQIIAETPQQQKIEPFVADWKERSEAIRSIRAKAALERSQDKSGETVRVAKPNAGGEAADGTSVAEALDRETMVTGNFDTLLSSNAEKQLPSFDTPSDPSSGVFALPKEVAVGANDLVATDALTELPMGEGFEALVSANTQGKLIELGVEQYNDDRTPKMDENSRQVIVPLRRGMKVKAGDVLGKQFNQEFIARKKAAEKQLEVAVKEAGKKLEIEVAELAAMVAETKYQRAISANRAMPGAVAEEEVHERAYEWSRSKKAWDKAIYDLEIKGDEMEVRKAEIEIADAQLEERKLVSPIDGEVDEIYQNEGQWLREGDRVFHVIRLDKMMVKARFNASVSSPSAIQGKTATIYVSLPGTGMQKFEGTVTYAQPKLENSMFIAYVSIDNIQNENGSWFLIPGMRAHVVVHL